VGLNQPLGFVSEEPPLEAEADEGRKKRRKRLVADADASAQAEGKVTMKALFLFLFLFFWGGGGAFFAVRDTSQREERVEKDKAASFLSQRHVVCFRR